MKRSYKGCALVLGVLAGGPLVRPQAAQGYRNPERFAAPVQVGGGGGRYFTLSRAEGYGCAVCHTPGEPVAVNVQNLPKTGFNPGQPYRITVDWPDDMPSVALNVELTDYSGAPFGQLLAADPLSLSAADLCREGDTPSAGQSLLQDPSGRRVMLIAECGQAQTSFDWIAPNAPAQGYFSASITFTNRDGKLDGDRVVDISETIGLADLPSPATNVYENACALLEVRVDSSGWWDVFGPAALLSAFALWRRSSIRMRARSDSTK